MSVIIPVEVSANYDADEEKLSVLNPHLVIYYDNEVEEKVSFNVDFDENDHYATFEVKLDDLLEAISKAMREKD